MTHHEQQKILMPVPLGLTVTEGNITAGKLLSTNETTVKWEVITSFFYTKRDYRTVEY